MSLNNQNNINELLRKYYNGQLSDLEKNTLEQQAQDDPFLREAMDGFDEHPGGFNEFSARHIRSNNGSGKTFLIAAIAIALLGGTVAVMSNYFPTEEKETTAMVDSDTLEGDYVEVEVLRTELKTLKVAIPEEQITAAEIVQNKLKIEQKGPLEGTAEEEESQPVIDHSPIHIEEDDNQLEEEEFQPVDDNQGQRLENSAPATYLHDIYVVDYREIKRTKTDISYKRYDLPGTSANVENDEVSQDEDLVERDVHVPYIEYLSGAMEYFGMGRYKQALNRYKTIQEQYKTDINAYFYGGLCYFNMRKFQKALTSFDQVLDHELNAFKEEAKWYKAKTLLKLKREDEARDCLDQIIIQGGFYLEDAIRLRKSL